MTEREKIVDWIIDFYAWTASGGHRRGEITISGLSGQEECDMFRCALYRDFAIMSDQEVFNLEGKQRGFIKEKWKMFELRTLSVYKENQAYYENRQD